MTGILLFSDTVNRFIVQPLNEGGILDETKPVTELHCGDCLTIRVKQDDWRKTRIELVNNVPVFGWHFENVGPAAPLIGHTVLLDD